MDTSPKAAVVEAFMEVVAMETPPDAVTTLYDLVVKLLSSQEVLFFDTVVASGPMRTRTLADVIGVRTNQAGNILARLRSYGLVVSEYEIGAGSYLWSASAIGKKGRGHDPKEKSEAAAASNGPAR